MKFRIFAIAVFAIGLSSFVISLFLVGPKDVSERNPDFAAATTLVTDENYRDIVLASEKPVVLDFYAVYCPVCRQLESQLLPVAEKHADAALFARVNVVASPELAEQYQVRAFPTLVMIHQGEVIFQSPGLSALPTLQTAL
jgi:thioredoxin 1